MSSSAPTRRADRLPIPKEPLFGPRTLKPRGGVDWCWQTLSLLCSYYDDVAHQFEDVGRVLGELEASRAWEVIPPEQPFGSLEAMVEAVLGVGVEAVRGEVSIAWNNRDRQLQAAEDTKVEKILPQHTHPDRQIAGHIQGNRASAAGISERQQRKLDTLFRHFPALFADVRAGTKSVHAACIEAGLDAERICGPRDPVKLARAIRRRLTADELSTLIDALGEVDG